MDQSHKGLSTAGADMFTTGGDVTGALDGYLGFGGLNCLSIAGCLFLWSAGWRQVIRWSETWIPFNSFTMTYPPSTCCATNTSLAGMAGWPLRLLQRLERF